VAAPLLPAGMGITNGDAGIAACEIYSTLQTTTVNVTTVNFRNDKKFDTIFT
jgi:hypothetical protein